MIDLKKVMLIVATMPKEEALERLSRMIREELEEDGEIDLRKEQLAEKIGRIRSKQHFYDSILSSGGKGEIDLREFGRGLADLFAMPDEEERK